MTLEELQKRLEPYVDAEEVVASAELVALVFTLDYFGISRDLDYITVSGNTVTLDYTDVKPSEDDDAYSAAFLGKKIVFTIDVL
jgi:hypothetical protein